MATPNSQSQGNRGKRKQVYEEKVRLLNLKKRKDTLFKKCHELAVKSDVQVCLVCMGPEGEIEAWPDCEKAKAMLTKHKEERAEKNGEIKKEKPKTEEKRKADQKDSGKLSGESLTALLSELDSKLETLDEKIQKLSSEKATNFCNSENNCRKSTEVYALDDLLPIESYYLQPWVSSVEPNQGTQYTEESIANSTDMGCPFSGSIGYNYNSWWVPQNHENYAMNEIWQPNIEVVGNDMNGTT